VSEILSVRPADDTWGVYEVASPAGDRRYRRKPCATCPWAKDSPVGAFPPEAFIESARTAYDLATHTFGCHTSGADVPTTCAGFILAGSAHNLGMRMSSVDPDTVSDGGRELYASYRAMAVANGVPADHPALARCRDDGAIR
jgi:hypothetical protein